jgi:hypothetical protein
MEEIQQVLVFKNLFIGLLSEKIMLKKMTDGLDSPQAAAPARVSNESGLMVRPAIA